MKIWAKASTHSEGKFLVVRRDGTVPRWPHFVLGARDPAAPDTLRAYADAAERLGFDQEYCDSVRELADDFDEYRAAHGAGDPEAPPHRTDNGDVIQAMRGGSAVISVGPDASDQTK